MIVKIFILLTVLAVAHAVAVGGPWLGAGHLGAVSTQSSAINHVAPAASLGYAGAYGRGAPISYRHGWAGAPLGYGHGLLGTRYGGTWSLRHGAGLAKVW